MNFRFERLSDDNIHHLATLFKSVYKKQIAVSYLQCKYDTSYLHPHKFGYFAFHNNIPVAFSGMIPYLMEYNGKKELSVQTSDSMTHPSYERMGLFKSVAEKSYEDLRRERFSFIWSFPNEASVMAATKKLNWQITAPMTGYCIPVLSKYKAYAIRTANEIFYGKNSLQKIFERELTDEFPVNSLHKSGGVTTVRKVGYFNYKKFGTSCHVKINGIKIWLKYNGSFFIGDMDNLSKRDLQEVLIVLINKAHRCGATNIYFQSHTGSTVQEAFHSLYPSFISWKLVYHPLDTNFPLDRIKVTMGDLDSF